MPDMKQVNLKPLKPLQVQWRAEPLGNISAHHGLWFVLERSAEVPDGTGHRGGGTVLNHHGSC